MLCIFTADRGNLMFMYLNRVTRNFLADEEALITSFSEKLCFDSETRERITRLSRDITEKLRQTKPKAVDFDSFVQQYGLETKEGLALMTLAEALLRIPDSATANAMIRDKIKAAKWLDDMGKSSDWFMKAAGIGLAVSKHLYASIFARLGEPVIRQATVHAMTMLGHHFVLGRSIEDALQRAKKDRKNINTGYSFDMLGEAARTMEVADQFFKGYQNALSRIAQSKKDRDGISNAGLSVKLSALHPRYEYKKAEICVPFLKNKVLELARQAKHNNVNLTIDAEESWRLELSLAVFEAVFKDPSLKDWDGLGLAVQAYQKRALDVIDFLAGLSEETGKAVRVRLVKGAYWDTEIRHAQVNGLADYPVFTRKINTDICYLACAKRLLDSRDRFYPMLATHNVRTIFTCLELAGPVWEKFEFQRLHGMGEALYEEFSKSFDIPVTIYAPVGTYEDLLPYLVRRLLENGANSSFVNKIADKSVPLETLLEDPVEKFGTLSQKRHPHISLPLNIYAPERQNSKGYDLQDDPTVTGLIDDIRNAVYKTSQFSAGPVVNGKTLQTEKSVSVLNPAKTGDILGRCFFADDKGIEKALKSVSAGQKKWQEVNASNRAQIINAIADHYERDSARLIGLLMRECGKTLQDSVLELREAVDFCRYYAAQGARDCDENGIELPGPTGEKNTLYLLGRGVFVCISPWNFPLAIFTGQVMAALMAGNSVIAKPSEESSLTAFYAVSLMLKAGLPKDVIALLPGDGEIGRKLTEHPEISGVAFTGSTGTARAINKTLASREGAIIPLIAETGGQNAMIADASALPEQLVDDVINSAFYSAGQRCSACRVLYVQSDIADKVIDYLKGAMIQLSLGDPLEIETDIGPVISQRQKNMLEAHLQKLQTYGREIYTVPVSDSLKKQGYFFGPAAYEIQSINHLEGEIFGPVLHVIRYKAGEVHKITEAVNATGYGLTFGVHSRIQSRAKNMVGQSNAGNCYINRSVVGSVVGTQPFGGNGLSGTGPKAGGPFYLHRFAIEKTITDNTAAAGGNASLLSLKED